MQCSLTEYPHNTIRDLQGTVDRFPSWPSAIYCAFSLFPTFLVIYVVSSLSTDERVERLTYSLLLLNFTYSLQLMPVLFDYYRLGKSVHTERLPNGLSAHIKRYALTQFIRMMSFSMNAIVALVAALFVLKTSEMGTKVDAFIAISAGIYLIITIIFQAFMVYTDRNETKRLHIIRDLTKLGVFDCAD